MAENQQNSDDHVTTRRRSRRQIARVAFGVSVALGAAVIIFGLTDDAAAKRVADMSGFLTLYFGGLYGLVSVYFGVGSYENVNAPLGAPDPRAGLRG